MWGGREIYRERCDILKSVYVLWNIFKYRFAFSDPEYLGCVEEDQECHRGTQRGRFSIQPLTSRGGLLGLQKSICFESQALWRENFFSTCQEPSCGLDHNKRQGWREVSVWQRVGGMRERGEKMRGSRQWNAGVLTTSLGQCPAAKVNWWRQQQRALCPEPSGSLGGWQHPLVGTWTVAHPWRRSCCDRWARGSPQLSTACRKFVGSQRSPRGPLKKFRDLGRTTWSLRSGGGNCRVRASGQCSGAWWQMTECCPQRAGQWDCWASTVTSVGHRPALYCG